MKGDGSDFDGKSWRQEGSRDDEHYFKSRPDKKFGDKKFGDKRERRGQKEEFKPLFEGDFDHHVNRHSFKWGDRKADYQSDDRNIYDREDYAASLKERTGGDRSERRERTDRKPFDRKGSDRKPFGKGPGRDGGRGGKGGRSGRDDRGGKFRK